MAYQDPSQTIAQNQAYFDANPNIFGTQPTSPQGQAGSSPTPYAPPPAPYNPNTQPTPTPNTPNVPPPTDVSGGQYGNLVGSSQVPGQTQQQFYNTQTNQPFSTSQQLADFYNQQTGTSNATSQNVFDLLKSNPLNSPNATGANFSSSNISGNQPPNLYDLYNQELTNRGVNTANQQLLDVSQQINQGQQVLAPLGMSHYVTPPSLEQLVTGGATQAQLDLKAAQAAAPIQTAMSFLIQSRSALSNYITNQSALAKQAVDVAQQEYENKLKVAGYVGQPQIIQDNLGNSYAVLTKADGSKEIDPVVNNQGQVNAGFNTGTTPSNGGGSASSGGNGSLVSTNPNPSSNIGGYDFTNYNESGGANISSAYSQVPQINSANDAQNYISKFSNSPITGAMVMSSSQKYGVDPRILLAAMQGESSMGTKGMAVSTFNPGNVGNETGVRSNNLKNWQNGVDRLALNISERKMATAGTGANTAVLNNTLKGQNQFGVDLSRLPDPTNIAANYVQETSDANHYLFIDSSNPALADGKLSNAAAAYARANGIQYLSNTMASAVKTSNVSLDLVNSLQNSPGFALLPHQKNGLIGNAETFFSRLYNAGSAAANQTPNGNALAKFQTTAALAIKDLQDITSGAAGARFSTSLLSQVSSLNPSAFSTFEGATAQINNIKDIIKQMNSEIFRGQKPALSSFVK